MKIRKPDRCLALGAVLCSVRLAAQRPVEAKDLLRIRRCERSAALTRRRVGGLYGEHVGHGGGQARRGRLDVELGRQAQRPAHLQQGERSTRRAGARTDAISPSSPPATTRARWSRSGCSTGPAARRSGSPISPAASPTSPGRPTEPGWRSSPPTPTPTQLAAGQDSSKKRPRPIVIDRFRFKYDEVGYIGAERDHLYLFDPRGPQGDAAHAGQVRRGGALLVARRAVHRLSEPAAAGVRPHRQLGHLRGRRHSRARSRGSSPPIEGADGDPEWGSRAAGWSPDGKLIAYVQGGKPELLYYGGHKLAVVPVDGGPGPGAHGVARPQRPLAGLLAGRRLGPLPAGGRPGLPSRPGTRGRRQRSSGWWRASGRSRTSRVGRDGRIAVTSEHARPARPRSSRSRDGELRKVSAQNDAWLAEVRLAPLEEISVQEPRRHRASTASCSSRRTIARARAIPTLLRIHGGPVWQFFHDFANLDWQVFAAQRLRGAGREPAGQLGPGREVRHRDLRGLGREGRRRRAGRGGPRGRSTASPIPSGWASAGGATAGS